MTSSQSDRLVGGASEDPKGNEHSSFPVINFIYNGWKKADTNNRLNETIMMISQAVVII